MMVLMITTSVFLFMLFTCWTKNWCQSTNHNPVEKLQPELKKEKIYCRILDNPDKNDQRSLSLNAPVEYYQQL